jgi:deferrochelatase/peroxidase EfeB
MPIDFFSLPRPLSPADEANGAGWLSQTQGLVLVKHRRPEVWHFLLRFGPDLSRVRGALAGLPLKSVVDLRSPRTAGQPTDTAAFVGFSSAGLAKLGGPRMAKPFQEGFRKRSAGPLSGPAQGWRGHWAGDRFDAIVVAEAGTEQDLNDLGTALSNSGAFQAIALEKRVHVPHPTNRPAEHSGFVDGVSQPAFFADDLNPPQGPPISNFNPAVPLSVILFRDPVCPNREDCFGSHLAYIRIEQNMVEFNKLANPHCLVGRNRDGSPLVPGTAHEDDFTRASDPRGQHWAIGSHISKMNPRDGLEPNSRIFRQGVAYQDGAEKGLLFLSFQAFLDAQFELLFKVWASNPHHPRQDAGVDPILTKALTTVRGGEYFYFPSIPGVTRL